ncbi:MULTISPECIES: bifunctional 3-(3-hydroxy-phenyl)propionate/3-hydroxycinnamic acid hydroxylase [Rhizobium/Agrobacterium group]|uniref:Monooxygenase FAD-binding n=3 Tax=Rhizobium/Agrobacterium group TaxID=227290 RepID=B9K5C7_ALLAM|nr:MULTISPECIES: bifunctional 3-(3-hydroxy-phenyl)propionate/3-hydroxycinnamic acid hydroxylase [Rhizobium/Agrobacterium group]ACM40075.1 monooxygenase FAD-binding [Allorhizobium ampelinum S4]MCF1450213.1 bifunctional 3-(3-hydroxy-phenyl)propionate/3-hydroxycinnamic acid hydroxylase [Allorhizobium ampelinum]MCF1493736.1 bifunctional 3-(3-hydroxy-phenyl)propionate/3-hydroxycinnamic acid hydroxylase [Allorhizobium ampelinum]MUO28449.1 bifunctional 3-(3-hydroxy-phenyl)propionate/3-hydroxycinnamic 
MVGSVDVVIVGLGPTGATLANLLCSMDLTVCIVEADETMFTLPRATHFDGEVMRVFQTLGLADKIKPDTHVNPGMTFINAQHEVILHWPRPAEMGPQNWHGSYRFHQPALETVLREGLNRFPQAKVLSGCEVVSLEQGEDGVVAQYRTRKTGETASIKGRYLVGCDGGRSPVRGMISSQLEDLGSHERWIVVDLLMNRDVDGLTDGTVQFCNPVRPTTFMRCVKNRRRWEFMVMPGDDLEQLLTPEGIWGLLSPWLTPDDGEIERAVTYFFHAVMAKPWRVDRVLLAGDAAHQTPPFLGQGLCAGIRDSSNLAWKLASVIKGTASEELLDTYEQERAPHVRKYIENAIQIGSIIQTVDPELARERDENLAKGGRFITSINAQLGEGLHGSEPLPAGMISRQPILTSGRPLDDVVGNAFVVLGAQDVLDKVSQDTRRRWHDVGLVCLADEGGDYLAEIGAMAIIIRPDRYILGIANSPQDLDRISELLPTLGQQTDMIGMAAQR